MKEKFSYKRMNKETKATNEVSLIKAHFVRVGMTSPINIVRNPNLNKRRKLEPIPNYPFVLLFKSTMYTLSLMWSRWRRKP